MFSRVFSVLENSRQETACMLPNVARYQLRHTPIFERYVIISHRDDFFNIFLRKSNKFSLKPEKGEKIVFAGALQKMFCEK